MKFKNILLKFKTNKILEVIELKQKDVVGTGSFSVWQKGYPESQWELLCRLKNGRFYEDSKNLIFYTSKYEKICYEEMKEYNQDKKDYIIGKTSDKIIYGAPSSYHITKSLKQNGVFEITDRVGHYIKLKVKPMVYEVSSVKKDFKSVKLNGSQLALLYIGFSNSLFTRPQKGEVFYESNSNGDLTLYLKNDYFTLLTSSFLKAYYEGKFSTSNAENEWIDLKDCIDSATISERKGIESLKPYEI